jgi:hypothetical protein
LIQPIVDFLTASFAGVAMVRHCLIIV